jgi:NAD(P)-dependent dehydrogenase (short-subunit alcohol dehydrogenase family)
VVVGDINECPEKNGVTFQQTDTRDWNSQAALFKKAIEVHGKIDHVFANAGE